MPKKQVLIVDDDPAALEAMGAALCQDFRIFLARDISTAKAVLDKEAIDLVVLDVVFEQESGLDFLDRLRETSDIPVLLVSGYGTKDMVIAGIRARASDYLDKPFTASQLVDRVGALIAQGQRPNHIADRIRRFLQQHYMQEWTVESLASELRLSVRTMRQMFRQRFRQSVMDFLEEVRVTRARELLATTDLSIHEVAAEVGFRDPHYFGRVFHQHVGKSPRQFRAEQRHEPTNPLSPAA